MLLVVMLAGSLGASAGTGQAAGAGTAAGPGTPAGAGIAALFAGTDAAAVLFAVLRWIGALTALFGALMAVFQEDIKRLFAYSSMSQVGYILLALGLMTHLGWVAALYIAFLHMLFKGLLFLVTVGVVYRSGTRLM